MNLALRFLEFIRALSPALASELEQLVTAINKNFRLVPLPFVATNFTGSGAMTWTVIASNVAKLYYRKTGSIITLWVVINATTVGGTPSTALQIDLPLELAAKDVSYEVGHALDNSVGINCVGILSGSRLSVFRTDLANWTAGTAAVRLTMDYEAAR